MGKQLQFRRLVGLSLFLGLAFVGLAARLFDLQVVRHDELQAKAQQNTLHKIPLQARRGDILDARGNLLATSVFLKTVCADPSLLGNRRAEVAHAVAPLLQMGEADLFQRLEPRVSLNKDGKPVTNSYVVLKHKVSEETWGQIQRTMAALNFGFDTNSWKKLSQREKGFYANLRGHAIFTDPQDDQLRVYPNQNLAAQVLGFTGVRTDGNCGGVEGIESTFNEQLSGVPGWRLTETDHARHELVALREQEAEPRNGDNVVLTIDGVVQHYCEEALAEAMQKHSPVSASAIVVRPRTGEILAMATLPNFDPNNPGASPADNRRNRVVSDLHEPGSTFKIVVVSGALNDQAVKLTDEFNCENGHFLFAGKELHDHEPYGILSVKNIITKSSNIGAAKIGIKMGEERLYSYARDYGFGERTGIPLNYERDGILNQLKNWTKLSISRVPMGHEVAVTPLQMTMAMCAIANHGVLMRPMIVSQLEDENHNVVAGYSPQRVRQVIGENADREMIEALKTVATPDGTAAAAAMAHYTVAGKTGTAQVADKNGYLPGKYFASFIGFFPADNPELCIAVMLDEPKEGYYGGQVAAPVFKQIAERAANYLNIRPDRDDDKKNEPLSVLARNN